jgi:hypothetical protein
MLKELSLSRLGHFDPLRSGRTRSIFSNLTDSPSPYPSRREQERQTFGQPLRESRATA